MTIRKILAELEANGVLLKIDAKLPNVCAMIAGESVRGSWWAHPKSHAIFRALSELAEHADVMFAKLIGGKDTLIHRALWPKSFAIGSAREPWQLDGLDRAARALLIQVDREGELQATGSAARALERGLLVHGEQLHTAAGSHAKRLQSWTKWAQAHSLKAASIPPAQAKNSFEKLLDHLNRTNGGRSTLPWTRSEGLPED